MRLTLKCALIAVLTASLSPGAGAAQTLRQAAARIGLLAGTAVNAGALADDPDYSAALAREYSMAEPENQMKWRAIEPAEGKFNFGPGDALAAFAEAHHMKVRGHNLLWGIYNPEWLTNGHFSPEELRQIMKRHIQTEVSHYRGKVFAWDVVNEAIDKSGGVKHSIWYDQPGIGLAGKGTAYIAQAFRWAHEADPHALLFYNDYGAEGLNAKSDAIYEMAKDFKRHGVPIDGVGLQMHLFNLDRIPSGITANIERLGKLGIEVHITEMDVALPLPAIGATTSPGELARQAEVYRKIAAICASHPACTAFQTWGFTDKYSWIPGYTKGKKGAALIFNAKFQPKPAYNAMIVVFTQAAEKNPRIKNQRLEFEKRIRAWRVHARPEPPSP
ncbi:MAG: endo-1,4-beta-xylanase [Acidobacteriota bacterium]|nr:endo-1,4-beta-xylanase [Acidobacteriota bacterium]